MTGSIIDHAVALTCFLLALKMDVWLVLGYGIPHGSAAWVLSKEYSADQDVQTHYIYDVVRNEKYNVTDEFCTLLRIYCVVNGENVSIPQITNIRECIQIVINLLKANKFSKSRHRTQYFIA